MVGGPGGGGDTMAVGGKMHGGQQWDYVFDVDAEEGSPPRKLPANRGEDPYVVADRFLMEEGLPISYRHDLCCCAPVLRQPPQAPFALTLRSAYQGLD